MFHRLSKTLAAIVLLSTAYPLLADSDSRAEQLLGEAILRAQASGTVMIAVDLLSDEGEADGVIDQYFLFSVEPSGQQDGQRWIPNALLTFTGRKLMVRDLDGNYLATFSMEPCEALALRQVNRETVTLCDGFELARIRVGQPAPETALKAASDSPVILTHLLQDPSLWPSFLTVEPQPIFDAEPCIAGGIGSSSCKVTCYQNRECEVQCQSGYYSCCSCIGITPYCRCKKDSGGNTDPPEVPTVP